MKASQWKNTDYSEKWVLMRRFFLISLCTCCMMMLTGTPAQADLPYILEEPSTSSLMSSMKITGPLDFCGEPVPLNDPDVRERLERELLVMVWNRPQVILWMKRAGRYMPYIEETLRQNKMPGDLKYLAIIESSLISQGTSSKGAKGYWQFMESTGKRYGLSIDANVDERMNFYASTRAALNYLKELRTMLGSWTLAAAAYNMGEEGLKAEMLIQKTINYYRLYLPQETQRYLFRAVSVKMILSNPEKYGITLAKEELYPPLQFDRVELLNEQETPISLVAQAARTYFKVVKDLNPEVKGYYLAKGQHVLSIPKGSAEGFQARYKEHVREWEAACKENIYVVKQGENLSSIAAKFGVPLPALLRWNRLSSPNKIKPGDRLLIFPNEGISIK
jgi:membrane-bound lytic murein transglycosylase D